MPKEKMAEGEKKRKRPQQPADPVEADREVQADPPVQNVTVDETTLQQVDVLAQNVIVDEKDEEKQVAIRQAKGKGPVLERTDTEIRIDVSPSYHIGDQTMVRVFSELEALKKANAKIQRVNYEKDLRIRLLETQSQVLPSSKSMGKATMLDHFTPSNQDRREMVELKALWQTGSLASYIKEFNKRVTKIPRLDDYARGSEFLGGLKAPLQSKLLELETFPERYSDLLKVTEKMIPAEVESSSASKTQEVPRQIMASQKGEGSSKPWKGKSKYPFKPKKLNPGLQNQLLENLKDQMRVARRL
ncbi:hypothetical protein R1sor_019144 [Riccia sorocarpa]|uniref:Retrotransposon gag domain-containing protein n=1 Tax=Riccia sorocarpa TaxID=122646 RepID=A0ABD3IEE8_9MARC